MGTTAFLLSDSSSLFTDSNNNEWILTPLHWFSPMGLKYQCNMGIPGLLLQGHAVPHMYHCTGAVNSPFPGGILGRCRKTSSRYGIFVNSTKSGCWVQTGVQTDCHVDTPLPGLPSHAGRCSSEATAISKWGCQLTICLHQNEWCHGPCATGPT